ncbi:MAG: chorismate synthase [Paludibacteraceae bacterium]|nr:chorismate synthase [Paludibacteraceae bacterium]
MSNTIGTLFRLTSFGESHGKGIGGIIDGCPPNIEIDEAFIQTELNRRRPGQSSITSPRDESDTVDFLSGIFEGKTTGAPIAFAVWNKNQQSKDYDHLKDIYRPSHADFTYQTKYGIRDHRGGGRTSARETIARVVAGAVAKLVLQQQGVLITGFTSQVGHIALPKSYQECDFNEIEKNAIRCPDPTTAEKMIEYIKEIRAEGNTIGGIITCVIKGVPAGWGEPVFNKLHASLGNAMLSINACKGFEYGSGFNVLEKGSELNDEFYTENGQVKTRTNNSGGIQGGISNGQDIYFRVAFKPVATVLRQQNTIDKELNETTMTAHGRHDPCVLPRAVPIVEAMAAITLLDMYLLNKTNK